MKKLFLLAFLTPFLSLAQPSEAEVLETVKSGSEQEMVTMNSLLIQENYLYLASKLSEKLFSLNPQSSNYNYRFGYTTLNSESNFERAIQFFLVAVKDTKKNYDMYSSNETSAPIDAFFHLASCYHLNQEIDNAIKYYQQFIDNSSSKSEKVEIAQLRLIQCDVAKREIANPKSAIVRNIGNVVNDITPEYAPVISLDGYSLYFTTRRQWIDGSTDDLRDPTLNQYPEDIYVSYADVDGEWTSPEKLEFCDSDLNEATIGVSSDERRIYVYQDMTGDGDIYYSDLEGNKFEDLGKLDYNDVNTKYWETHCTMTPDGQNMYFVSNRPGGFGGRDIYRIVKLPNGEWSKAMNMGPTINTPFDEDSPFIAVNNKTLYYSSNGDKSMGGFDVFVSFVDEENVWSTPANMGYPINSTGDDIFYTTTVDGLKGYLSSFRKGGHGEKDIYEILNDYLGNSPISSIVGTFIPAEGQPLPENISAIINCNNCNSESQKIINPRIKNGSYFASLLRCKDYVIEFYSEGKLLHSETFNTLCSGENEELRKDYIFPPVYVPGVDIAEVIKINPIYFDLDKSNIRPDAALELDKIVLVMNEHPELVVALGSHTDCRASKKYNMSLSDRRAKASAEYIKAKITNPERIYGRGYGESRLINDCGCEGNVKSDCSEEEHQENRRTEFIIVEELEDSH